MDKHDWKSTRMRINRFNDVYRLLFYQQYPKFFLFHWNIDNFLLERKQILWNEIFHKIVVRILVLQQQCQNYFITGPTINSFWKSKIKKFQNCMQCIFYKNASMRTIIRTRNSISCQNQIWKYKWPLFVVAPSAVVPVSLLLAAVAVSFLS